MFAENMTFWIVGLTVVCLTAYFAAHVFAPDVRERRRCRRNHRKVITRARRPMVMLSVRTPRARA